MAESRLERIRKCLALAKKNDNIHEAESAMKMAQRLALKEGVDLNDIEAEEEHERKVVQWTVPQKTQTAPLWRFQLACVIGDNFRCKVWKSVSGDVSYIVAMGLESDIEVFKVMFDYAETCLDVFFKRFLAEKKKVTKLTRHDSLVLRNSYVHGFLTGITKAFEQNVECYSLSLCLPEEVTTALSTMKFKTIHSKSTLDEEFDNESYVKGREDGEEAGNRNRLEE